MDRHIVGITTKLMLIVILNSLTLVFLYLPRQAQLACQRWWVFFSVSLQIFFFFHLYLFWLLWSSRQLECNKKRDLYLKQQNKTTNITTRRRWWWRRRILYCGVIVEFQKIYGVLNFLQKICVNSIKYQ